MNRAQNIMYGNLNALYWSLFGESSLVISSFVPKDNFMHLKFLTMKIFSSFVKCEHLSVTADWDELKNTFDSFVIILQYANQVTNHLDFSSLIPETEKVNPESEKKPDGPWIPLDHSTEAKEVRKNYDEGKISMVTAKTGAGKSTDFILNLKDQFRTVYLCQPRRILVMSHVFNDKPKLFAGTADRIRQDDVNLATNGYLAVVAPELTKDDIIVLDEFHEMDENAMWLLYRYGAKCCLLTATPNFPRSERFNHIPLAKARNSDHVVTEIIKAKPLHLDSAVVEHMQEAFTTGSKKILYVHPSYTYLKRFANNLAKLFNNKRLSILYKNNREIGDYDIYLATSVADAGLTIPGVDFVIDSGLQLGYKGFRFGMWDSNGNIKEQRKGRTGRTCSGTYIRLNNKYDEKLFDTSYAFMINHSNIIEWFTGVATWPLESEAYVRSVPYQYNDIFNQENGWSIAAFLTFYFQAQDMRTANELYCELLNGNTMNTMINTIRSTFRTTRWIELTKVHSFLNKYTFDGVNNDIDVQGQSLMRTVFE
jgi:hypothetical protein